MVAKIKLIGLGICITIVITIFSLLSFFHFSSFIINTYVESYLRNTLYNHREDVKNLRHSLIRLSNNEISDIELRKEISNMAKILIKLDETKRDELFP